MIEVTGNMHMHTHHSDGEGSHDEIADAAIEAGLDFIIVTDHNVWIEGMEGYYENENGRVLRLIGEEVHDIHRQPQANHFLAYGVNRSLAEYAADPQQLIDKTNAAGGYGFLAHPHDSALPIINEADLGWHDWDIDRFAGLEIWNYMSNLKASLVDIWAWLPIRNAYLAKLYALPFADKPERQISTPRPETLAVWDALLAQGKRISAIGGSDAHAATVKIRPFFKRVLYPYAFLFRSINTHLNLPHSFTGDVEHDKMMVLDGMGNGRAWVGYDLPHSTAGFRFTAEGGTLVSMGEEMQLDGSATLQVQTPASANIRIVRHGEEVASVKNSTELTHIARKEGAYRVECTIKHAGKERGWIYSNPIYLR